MTCLWCKKHLKLIRCNFAHVLLCMALICNHKETMSMGSNGNDYTKKKKKISNNMAASPVKWDALPVTLGSLRRGSVVMVVSRRDGSGFALVLTLLMPITRTRFITSTKVSLMDLRQHVDDLNSGGL
ncbi:hypothetical protein YC2023_099494 [Brassica napus]